MDTPIFSSVVIAKNEAKTLPKLAASLKEFMDAGGEVLVLDTGSTDGTADIARSLGCTVHEVGDQFRHDIDEESAHNINERFVVDEAPIVKAGDHYFHFADARNMAASLAKNDMISMADADEAFTRLDVDGINALITAGKTQFEYNFIFSHNPDGSPSIQFTQSKFYDRRTMHWNNAVHEVLAGSGERAFLTPDLFKLEHWQIPGDRHSYLIGLAVDCYQRPEDDRNSHYLARELFWAGRYKSALKEFERHVAMNRWPAERAESQIYIGDCLGHLNRPQDQIEAYQKAYNMDGGRRKALLKLAQAYRFWNDPQRTAVYAAAALQIPLNGYYANDMREYTVLPHELLYWANGWMGNIQGARDNLIKCLEYEPYNPQYARDTKYYFEYPDSGIDGWMSVQECQWLYETAKKMSNILELGSWKGRSTHALASGCKGQVIAVDHWEGSKDVIDLTNQMAKVEDVYKTFLNNMKDLKNVKPLKMSGDAADFALGKAQYDMVFIDAGHTYEEVKNDIEKWLPHAKILMSGDDYMPGTWMGVVQAVDEAFGKPDGVVGKIWYKWL